MNNQQGPPQGQPMPPGQPPMGPPGQDPMSALMQANQAIGELLKLNLPEYMHKPILMLVKGLQTMHQTVAPMMGGQPQAPQGRVTPDMLQQMMGRGMIGPTGGAQ